MLTKQQLVELIDNNDAASEWKYGEQTVIEHNGYKLKGEDSFGGEGMGDNFWYVFSVEKDGEIEYWEVPGWYSSGNGSETQEEEMFRVTRKQKTVDFWDAVK